MAPSTVRLSRRLGSEPFAILMAGLVVAELLVSGLALPQNSLTSPEAWSSMRPSLAYLLAQQQINSAGSGISNPPDRMLSSSPLFFDPGDLPDLRSLYGHGFPTEGVYDLVVATKLKEVVSPNLPLAWNIPSFDGYDGGVLPLARWVTVADMLGLRQPALDGRLRENLAGFPPARLLSLLNVRHFVVDRTGDNWQAGVFYDLGHPVQLDAGQPQASVAVVPPLQSTALGLISHLEGAADIPDNQVVGLVTVAFPGSIRVTLPIRAGVETAEGPYSAGVRHRQATLAWPDQPDYAARLAWTSPAEVPISITVRSSLPSGRMVVRGLALIDERTGAFQDLTLSNDGRWQRVYAGDVKIYDNLGTLPRAYLVPRAQIATDDQAARQALLDPTFDPAKKAVLVAPDAPAASLLPVASASSTVSLPVVQTYEPEHVAVNTSAPAPAVLVLSDSFYPGWQATIDDQPAPIYRANILFRAVLLPAGQHRVQFWYRPRSLIVGLAVSGVMLAALAGALGVSGVGMKGKKRQ